MVDLDSPWLLVFVIVAAFLFGVLVGLMFTSASAVRMRIALASCLRREKDKAK